MTETGNTFLQNIAIAFKNIGVTLTDWKYVLFLLIIGVFWTAYNQLYYSFPVFLETWVNLDKMSVTLGLDPGTITTVTISSLTSFFIILFQLVVSSVTARVRPLNSIMSGIFILGFWSWYDVRKPEPLDHCTRCPDLRDRRDGIITQGAGVPWRHRPSRQESTIHGHCVSPYSPRTSSEPAGSRETLSRLWPTRFSC
ncbi:MAG: hypothetical protein MZV63_68390 [Marinilabiliales bacterium]|nr:hypothetical protein [Marinilabiliales bacterium]